MSDSSKTFATAINCMDGRTQLPVSEFMKNKYNVDYVDELTYPGPDKFVGLEDESQDLFKKEVDISVNRHGSKAIAIVGHYDCAGNPVEKDQHIEDIKKSIDVISKWGFEAEVIGLYVNENWEVEEVTV